VYIVVIHIDSLLNLQARLHTAVVDLLAHLAELLREEIRRTYGAQRRDTGGVGHGDTGGVSHGDTGGGSIGDTGGDSHGDTGGGSHGDTSGVYPEAGVHGGADSEQHLRLLVAPWLVALGPADGVLFADESVRPLP